jgi:hypothetical protein
MVSMVIIFFLLAVTVLLFIGRFAEIFLNRYREKALARAAEGVEMAEQETEVIATRAA